VNCCQCQGIEELFSQKYVAKELSHYRTKGPDKTTRMLIDSIKNDGVEDLTLLDIGGGVGAIQYDLLEAGVQHVTSVDASTAYFAASREEARRRGLADRISYHLGNFVDLAPDIDPADIVTLDRVICCYHDMQRLVSLSAARARKLYGLVYPRHVWWVKVVLAIENLYFRLRRSPFRTFSHSTEAVERILEHQGFKRRSYHKTIAWQVMLYTR